MKTDIKKHLITAIITSSISLIVGVFSFFIGILSMELIFKENLGLEGLSLIIFIPIIIIALVINIVLGIFGIMNSVELIDAKKFTPLAITMICIDVLFIISNLTFISIICFNN
jgi:hypothetical protein